jgi:hypothetical protein
MRSRRAFAVAVAALLSLSTASVWAQMPRDADPFYMSALRVLLIDSAKLAPTGPLLIARDSSTAFMLRQFGLRRVKADSTFIPVCPHISLQRGRGNPLPTGWQVRLEMRSSGTTAGSRISVTKRCMEPTTKGGRSRQETITWALKSSDKKNWTAKRVQSGSAR